jgi:sigma-E processing peptidase SpoIIGA
VGKTLGIIIDLAVCALMCAVAFYKKKEGRRLYLHILVYFAVSMALGGFMSALFNLLNQVDIPTTESNTDGISVLSFAMLAGVSAVITIVGGRLFKSKSIEKSAELEIVISGKSKTVKGIFDSGNLLREPISAKPCIVCDREAIRDIVPYPIYKASKNNIRALDGTASSGIRFVPIKTAGGSGMLVAISAEQINIKVDGRRHSVDAYIALGELGAVSEGAYALIPIELVK